MPIMAPTESHGHRPHHHGHGQTHTVANGSVPAPQLNATIAASQSPVLFTIVSNLVSSIATVVPALIGDCLSVATRPVVLLGQFGIAPGTASSFASGSILTGLLGTFSAALVGVGVSSLCGCSMPRPMRILAAVPYLVDACAQLPNILMLTESTSYPTSRTGAATMCQLVCACFTCVDALKIRCDAPEWLKRRLAALATAVCLRFTALSLLGGAGAGAHTLLTIAALNALYCVTPGGQWERLVQLLGRAFVALQATFTLVYNVLVPALKAFCAQLKHACIWLLTRPILVTFYRRVLEPLGRLLDERLAPWILPIIVANVALGCAVGFASVFSTAIGHVAATAPGQAAAAATGRPFAAEALAGATPSPHALPVRADSASHLVGLAFCGVGAAVSAFILGLHAAGQSLQRPVDPLQSQLLTGALSTLAYAIAAPWKGFRFVVIDVVIFQLLRPLWPLLELIFNALSSLVKFAINAPLLSIPLTLAFNIYLLWIGRESSSWLSAHCGVLSPLVGALGHALGSLQSASFRDAVKTDTAFAFLLLGGLQVVTFVVVHQNLSAVHEIRR